MHPTIGADQRVHQVALKVKLKRNDIQNVLNNSYDSHQKRSLKNYDQRILSPYAQSLAKPSFFGVSTTKNKNKNVPC